MYATHTRRIQFARMGVSHNVFIQPKLVPSPVAGGMLTVVERVSVCVCFGAAPGAINDCYDYESVDASAQDTRWQ